MARFATNLRKSREKSLTSKTIHLWLNGPKMPLFSSQKTYKEPTDEGYEIYLRSLKIMAKMSQK